MNTTPPAPVVANLPLTQQDHTLLMNLLNKSLGAASQTNEGIAAAEAVTFIRTKIALVEEDSDGETSSDKCTDGTDVSDA